MSKEKSILFLVAFLAMIVLLSLAYDLSDREQYQLTDFIRVKEGYSYISLSKGTIHYQLGGSEQDPVIVLVHGGTIPLFNYNYQFPAFVDSGFRVLRYDQYGRGLSDRPNVNYTREFYCNLLLELLDSLKINEPVILLGHSFGGSTVVDFCSKYPDKVKCIVLFSPMINGISNMTAFRIVRFPLIGKFVARFLIIPLTINRVENFFDGSIDTVTKYRELFKEQMKYGGFEHSLFSMMSSNAMRDYSKVYRKVGDSNKNILLLWGDKDETITKRMIDNVRENMPQCKYVEVEGATHAFNFKQPIEFNKIVIRYLKKISKK